MNEEERKGGSAFCQLSLTLDALRLFGTNRPKQSSEERADQQRAIRMKHQQRQRRRRNARAAHSAHVGVCPDCDQHCCKSCAHSATQYFTPYMVHSLHSLARYYPFLTDFSSSLPPSLNQSIHPSRVALRVQLPQSHNWLPRWTGPDAAGGARACRRSSCRSCGRTLTPGGPRWRQSTSCGPTASSASTSGPHVGGAVRGGFTTAVPTNDPRRRRALRWGRRGFRW